MSNKHRIPDNRTGGDLTATGASSVHISLRRCLDLTLPLALSLSVSRHGVQISDPKKKISLTRGYISLTTIHILNHKFSSLHQYTEHEACGKIVWPQVVAPRFSADIRDVESLRISS